MKMSMGRKWKRLSFTTKLMVVNSIAILVVVLIVTLSQTRMFVKASEEVGISNLSMLTNQVCLNFKENQKNITDAIYARSVTFQIPSFMKKYQEKKDELHTAVAQMVTHSTEYDYVMLEMADGTRIDSGAKYTIKKENLSTIRKNCQGLLDKYKERTYGSNQWYRCEDGDVYILKEVYDIEPLCFVGRMVVHFRENPYAISDIYTDHSFLFFGEEGYLTWAGRKLPENVKKEIARRLKSGENISKIYYKNKIYYAEQYTRDQWTTVGISTMEAYQKAQEKIVYLGVVYGVLGMAVGIVIIFVLTESVVKKLKQLQQSMHEVARGKLDSSIPVEGDDDISQLAGTFNYMTNRISELVDEVVCQEQAKKDVEIEMLEYKYRSLQTQIRPHFIYNALETIGALAKMHEYEKIEKAVLHISRYFRNITTNTTKTFITVQQEFDSLKDYTEIYSFIHGNQLHTEYAAREQAKNAMVPTMIVQPIVENALKYGVKSKNESSRIRIHAYKQDENLIITVKDNGYGLSEEMEKAFQKNQRIPSKEQSGIGIFNVKERLNVLYGEKGKLEVHNRKEGGVKVTIIIPFSCLEPVLEDSDVFDDLDDLDWED